MIAFCIKHNVEEPTEKDINEQFTAACTYARQKLKRRQLKSAQPNKL